MFEQLVRPFTARAIITTRRVVPVKIDDTPEDAAITWGSTGKLPQGAVQPKSTNLENIESVGFNIRGSIDKFHQTSRESEQVAVPIRDNGGNQIGTATIDRAKEIVYAGRNSKGEPYLPNFGYNQNYSTDGSGGKYTAYMPDFTGVAAASDPPAGLRKEVPSANVSQRTDTYSFP